MTVEMQAERIAKYLRMDMNGLLAVYRETPFYESEYTPLVRSILKVYRMTNSISDKQFFVLAAYLAFRPEYH